MVLRTVKVRLVPQHTSEAVGSSKLQEAPRLTVLFVAQVMTGGVLSTTVTFWLQDAWLEQQSVACQVRVIALGQAPLVVVLRRVMITLVPQQTSETEGASKLQAEPHSTLLFVM